MKFKIILLLTTILMFGCATVPKASQADEIEAKQFLISDTESSIYIFRGGGIMGAALAFQISVDGKLLGSISPKTFHMVKVKPGNHSISVITNENNDFENITTKAGENYYFKVSPKMGVVTGRAGLTMVSQEEGMEIVGKSKLIKSMIY